MNQITFLKFKSYVHITAFHLKILLLGLINFITINFNMWLSDMKELCNILDLNHLVTYQTRFKSSNHLCIDNLYTNKNGTFFNSYTVETGISDHHILICTMLCLIFCKDPGKSMYYRSYKKYNREQFEKFFK